MRYGTLSGKPEHIMQPSSAISGQMVVAAGFLADGCAWRLSFEAASVTYLEPRTANDSRSQGSLRSPLRTRLAPPRMT